VIGKDQLPSPDDFSTFHPFLRGVFSQWHVTAFVIEGETFNTAEQWMMASKARLFADAQSARRIMATPDPVQQKRLGQSVSPFASETWDARKVDIVLRGNLAKFEQNDGARRQLLATGEAMLVEANPRDWIWGCGLAADDPGIQSPAAWRGENLLGRILTLVRQTLTQTGR
jgi:ribA/ribD-fused uncharacterized protein